MRANLWEYTKGEVATHTRLGKLTGELPTDSADFVNRPGFAGGSNF